MELPKSLIKGIRLHPDINPDDVPDINDPEKAIHVVRWIQRYCCLTKGKWQGKPFILLPWAFDLVWRVFGTLRPDGTRRYERVFILIPKKNAKTELCAALALYGLAGDGEKGAEVISAAVNKKQAGIAFKAAAFMVEHNPNTDALRKRIKVVRSQKRMEYLPTDSEYYVTSGDSGGQQGGSPSLILFDEIHEQPDDRLWVTLTEETGAAREQQLILIPTTAGEYNPQSIYSKLRKKAEEVRRNPGIDKAFLPILYVADKKTTDHVKKKPPSWEMIRKCNPAAGQVLSRSRIMRGMGRAWRDPNKFAWESWKRYRLNIDVGSVDAWMDLRKWDRLGTLTRDVWQELEGRDCYAGLDLSEIWDMSALALVFPPVESDGEIIVIMRYWCPKDGIGKRGKTDLVDYERWERDGWLTATTGNVVDEDVIQREIEEIASRYYIVDMGIDPYRARQLERRLTDTGHEFCTEILNSPANMSEPAKNLIKTVERGGLVHEGNPVISWNWGNLIMISRGDYVKPDKQKARGRIDGAYALLLAWGRMIAGEGLGNNFENIVKVIS